MAFVKYNVKGRMLDLKGEKAMRMLFICLFLCISSTTWAESPEDKKSQQQAAKEQRGTKNRPLAVEGISAQKSEAETREEREHRTQQAAIGTSVSDALKGIEKETERTTLLTLGLFAVAFLQATFFIWQLIELRKGTHIANSSAQAARRAVLMSRDNSRRELRAYLGVGDGEVFPLPTTRHDVIRGVVEIRNFGDTPAHNVRLAIDGELRKPGDMSPFEDPEFMPHTQPIAPTMGWIIGREFHEMSEQDMQDVLADRKLVYIWGRASYDDIYGKPHTLKFRLRNVVKVFSKTPEGLVMHKWKYYPEPEGNEAD